MNLLLDKKHNIDYEIFAYRSLTRHEMLHIVGAYYRKTNQRAIRKNRIIRIETDIGEPALRPVLKPAA